MKVLLVKNVQFQAASHETERKRGSPVLLQEREDKTTEDANTVSREAAPKA